MSGARVINATFYSFKAWSMSRKYYTTGRGHLSSEAFNGTLNNTERLAVILEQNHGLWPGLSSDGSEYFLFVVTDEKVDHGWPLMFDPKRGAVYDKQTEKE
jgi:hypothetical protein